MQSALDAHCDAHAAANAERGEAFLRVASLHFEQQRVQNARARGADRVADGNRAAINVYDGRIPAHVLVHRASLCGKGFIGFDQIEILGFPASFLQRLARRESVQPP